MDLTDEGVLDVDMLGDDGSEDEGEAPPSSDFYTGPASTPTSCASSPRGEEPASPHGAPLHPTFFHHQPYPRPFFTSTRRGPGRPRKEGVKLTREGKIVRRYRANPGSVRGAKRHRGSRDDSLDDLLDEDDFTMPAPEEPPYYPEKWPGKLCALCNLSERSQLGQGEMRQISCTLVDVDGNPIPSIPNSGGATPTSVSTPTSTPSTPIPPGLGSPPPELIEVGQHPLGLPLSRRQKGTNKCKTPLYNMEHTDELSIIGHVESLELSGVVSNSAFYLHRCCLEFTPPFQEQVAAAANSEEEKDSLEDARIKGIVTAAMLRKCAFCLRYGASIPCKMSCSKYFHLPCVLASGGFQDFQAKSSFCKDHLHQIPLICATDIDCRTCRVVGDITNLMTCVTCGAHYHGTCVGLAQLPGVRAGWSCRSCRVCQVCRGEPASGMGAGEARAVTCEHCDKLYHATCLRPIMATVPKYGWKCKCCRVCSDCGARSPGAGPSSRWHAHYTVCDSCYQQRNKGSCCPLCRRAYRAAAQRDMIRCCTCKRYVHGMCDPDAEPLQYRLKKEQNPLYEYQCPICKSQIMQLAVIKSNSFEEDGMGSASHDSSYGDDISQDQDPLALEPKPDIGLGKGKPYTVSSKVAKKKMGGYKLKGGYSAVCKLGFQKRQRSGFLDFGRKRGTKPKMRGVFGVPGLGLQRPQAPDSKASDDDPGGENKLVMCSSKDKFVLTQDLCVMCGAIGTDSEGCLIACAQCGQTYHPYCVNIKVSKVIVTLGWRCLDCTVCEGCGQRGDDALLVLCDDCDTAWHTYCAKPTLTEVPAGSWRCERCRRCLTCGTADTEIWCDNYTECGPCASFVMCCVCSEPYSDSELIIQCEACRRWLHAACDSIRNERDAEICCRTGYNCLVCRGRDVPPPHLVRIEPPPPPPARPPPPTPQSLGLAGEYYVDDVCLSQRGAHHMKLLEAEMGITQTRRKRRFKNENNDKDAVVQNVDSELGGDDTKPDSTADGKDDLGSTANPNYKEGTIWNVATEGPPPEGFTIYTTESGVTVLRRKRQRNLNKLGIGGFVVRQRQVTQKSQPDDEVDGMQPSGESPGNKRKPRRKPRSKLMEQFPSYMQEAFFGKELLEPTKPAITSTGNPLESPGGSLRAVTPEGYRELRDFKIDPENSDSDGDDVLPALTLFNDRDSSMFIQLNTEESDLLHTLKPKVERDDGSGTMNYAENIFIKLEGDTDDGHLKHTEDFTALKNAILGPPQTADAEMPPNTETIPTVHSTKTEPIASEPGISSGPSTISPKDDLSLLGVNLDVMVRDSLPDMDSNDVDEIFKGVLTDDSQESQESSVSYATSNSMSGTPYSQQRQQLQSPMEYTSPYHHTEYGTGNSQLSPAFSEGSGTAVGGGVGGHATWGGADSAPTPPATYNQRSADKMRADESLGSAATISAVLYANTNHPEWKVEFPNWVDRCKQILKKWRALPSEQKAPYLQRARDNRSAIRMKKAQQSTSAGAVVTTSSEAEGVAANAGSAGVAATTTAGPVRAPNVTVTAGGLLEADAHIRVLTPSEIMRTLPPLHTSSRDTEQERACGQQRSAREAEQERQWKQLQQMRQQQTQQQQQIIHDQRIQGSTMQRLRTPEPGEVVPTVGPVVGGVQGSEGAPRSVFPAQRFPLHYAGGDDINRQLRDLLQRHPDKMWPQQSGEDGNMAAVSMEGTQFRHPLPVGVRARPPLRPDHPLLIQQRLPMSGKGLPGVGVVQQASLEQKHNMPHQHNEDKPNITGTDSNNEDMDMGDMDKLEQDSGNIGEVGDILTGLSGEDDEELLESLTAEIGEEFNILEYADPELAAFNDAEHILDGLELADDVHERHAKREPEDELGMKSENKMDINLQKAIKMQSVIANKTEIKSELDEVKSEMEMKSGEVVQQGGGMMGHAFTEGGIQRVIAHNQLAMQASMQTVKTEVKLEGTDMKEGEWSNNPRPAFAQMFQQRVLTHHQMPMQQGISARVPVTGANASLPQAGLHRPQIQYNTNHHTVHFAQGGVASTVNTQSIVNAMTAQVNAALAAGRSIAPGTRLVGADGAVGVVRPDHTVALAGLPIHHAGAVGVSRAPPPPPYPGTLRQQPPPPYPQVPYEAAEAWPDWMQRRPLLLQEQPLLLEELLEQEKREQERETGAEWCGGGGVVSAGSVVAPPPAPPAVPAVPLYAGTAPPAPAPPPDRVLTEADRHAHALYDQWLQQYNAFVTDQLRYYEAEVQKLRKIRKSLNSKQRQLRKSGNELMPNDAAELRRVSTEQAALQKHLEAARKQARQHSMTIQEYETKHRQQNPQLVQQSNLNQQQMSNNQTVFTQNQNLVHSPQMQQQSTINRPMQIGLQGTIQQQTLVRTQQTVIGGDGQQTLTAQGRSLGTLVTPQLQTGAQGRILQAGRTLVIEQTGSTQQQLVRQLSGTVGAGSAGQYSSANVGGAGQQYSARAPTPRAPTARPAMSPLHVQSPHSQSPLHSLAPQSPLHHLTSPMQSPLHSQQSPLHHTSHSPLHSSTQSPLHSQQSPMHVQQTSTLPQHSPMHPQQSPLHPQQSPMHPQQSQLHSQQSPLHSQQSQMSVQQSQMLTQQSAMHSQQSSMHPQQPQMHHQQSPLHPHQTPMHSQQSPMHSQPSPMHSQPSPMHSQQSPMHSQQSPMHSQQSPMHSQQSPMHSQQSPLHLQQSPMHTQQSPMHTQQSPMQSSLSPQHFLQHLTAQITAPQLPTPSRSPHIYQQSQILSPVASHSPQLQQNNDFVNGRFSRPVSGCSPIPTRFARPPHHQQGMRVGVSFTGRQTSPLGSPQPLPSPGNASNDSITRQQILQRQQYSPMGGAPASPMSRSPHVARTPTPSASPAASPAPQAPIDHGGGHHHHIAPIPPGYRYFKPGLFGGAPMWPNKDRSSHINKVSILKRRTPPRMRFPGKTAAPSGSDHERSEDAGSDNSPGEPREVILYAPDGVDYAPIGDDSSSVTYSNKDDDDDIEEIVEEHLDDADIVVVEPAAISPEERIATEEDFEELIDSGKPEDEITEEDIIEPVERLVTRTETTTKTVAVISLATPKPTASNLHQYKIMNPTQSTTSLSRLPVLSAKVLSPSTKILNEVSQATVASVSIANQTISVPVLKSLSVPIGSVKDHCIVGPKGHIKKVPINLSNSPLNIYMTNPPLSKPISSVISVISSAMNVKGTGLNPVITLATTTAPTRVPVSILSQHQVKQKIVKTIEKPMALSIANTSHLSSLSVSHDATLPAKIFQDEIPSPDSTIVTEKFMDHHNPVSTYQDCTIISEQTLLSKIKESGRQDIDIESEISQHTELPHTLCISDRTPLLLGKADIKSPDPIPEKIPDNIMEGDDEDKPEDVNIQNNISLPFNKTMTSEGSQKLLVEQPSKVDVNVMKTIKAIANQTKDMVIDSNMQITSELPQESVQISIPSPTPSQEQYLNHITMQQHSDANEGNQKQVESFEDMLNMLENITDDNKQFPDKQAHLKMFNKSDPTTTLQHNPNINVPTKVDQNDTTNQINAYAKARENERLGLQAATVPQLSPLSQPAELTTNMANVSQQLRTIMSSLNTSKGENTIANTSIRKVSDATPTQVNFENLLPSSKVEIVGPRQSPTIHRQMEKPITSLSASEAVVMSATQFVGSRVNALTSLGPNRKSPTVSPINSPVGMQGTLIKSPTQSPLISNTFTSSEESSHINSVSSQIVKMPALSKIHNSSSSQSIIHPNNNITTMSSIHKPQLLSTSILSNTLLQPSRQISTSIPFSSQSISTSQPPALVMTSRQTMVSKTDAAPNVTVRTHNVINPSLAQVQGGKQATTVSFITSSTLLHSQLTSPLKRSKSTDEPKSEVIVRHIQPTKRHSVESVIVKSEPMETEDSIASSVNEAIGNKFMQQSSIQRNDESQNVLLKQLLQTTTTTATVIPPRTMTMQRTAPALGSIQSLEAQLARPAIPPQNLSLTSEVEVPKNSPRHITSRESPFNQRSTQIVTSACSMSPLLQTSTQSLMDVRRQPTMKISSKEETTPLPENSPTMKAMQMYPMNMEQVIKKEVPPPLQSPVQRPFTPMDVKKELLDESSQQSATSGVSTASDQGKLDQPLKEEFPESVNLDPVSETMTQETPSEAKKRKRREYQQKKRKQMQMNMKAAAENNINSNTTKKRPRKGSKFEEDYDTFIDNLMTQLRLLPPMQIQEPSLTTNFSVCPLFGSGDLSKLKTKDYEILKGDLIGEFGNAKIPNVADYYNTKPFGDDDPLPEKPPASTQRGFYDQEFQPIIFDEDLEEKKLDLICKERDTDTPDSIISCSSPECLEVEPPNRFPGIKLTDDDDDEDEDSDSALSGRFSPVIPIITPVALRIKTVSFYQIKEEEEGLKLLKSSEVESTLKSKMIDSPGSNESNENVTVTLTLTSGAAEDILGVLKELAGILHIPPPTSYQIIERTATPPSHKLGLYRSKGRDGKECTPIDIQSILNGAAKFCRHCDVVILDSVVRAKASEFPLLSANKGKSEGILHDSDSELYFCSTQCYERFAWRPTNIILDGKSKPAIKDDKSDIDMNLSKDRDDFDTASTESMETDDLDIKPDIKDEKMDLSFIDSLDNDELMKEVRDHVSVLDDELKQDEKSMESVDRDKYCGVRYKAWSPGCIGPPAKYKRPTDRELTELVFRTGVAIMPVSNEDSRKCELCGIQGDGVADGVSRLLNCDVDRWVHLNCALWSEGVYETVSGALMNVETALAAGSNATCAVCRRLGATVRCFKVRCGSVYHLGCAVKDSCVFYKNKTAYCSSHAPKGEKDNELTTLSVQRRVYVSRDEQRQVASVMLHCDTNHLIRVGGLIFLSPGHLLPHQLAAFHTPNYIYPIGYKIVRFYWSWRRANTRSRYVCWISECSGRPRFHVQPQDDPRDEVSAPTARAAWDKIVDAVAGLRAGRGEGALKLWPNYVTGEDLFGLTEPAVVRVLESLPGIETLTDYRFKFGRSALLEGGLAVNPSGCARCEARARAAWRRAVVAAPIAAIVTPTDHPACPYTKQFVHTKSSQYKKMKLEWRNNVYLARSKIQGLGLYAARDLEKHTMVIEYIGEIIRSELSEIREKQYEAKNRGIYMFRLDERRVVDATLSGGLARYINHSCQPNCVAETVEVDRNLRIIIFAKRRIARGEELAYDYKFDIEEDAHKISCMCGAPNCRKWMN